MFSGKPITDEELLETVLYNTNTDVSFAFDVFAQNTNAFENVLFMRAVKSMQQSTDAQKAQLKQSIFTTYLQDGAPQSTNLTAESLKTLRETNPKSPEWEAALQAAVDSTTNPLLMGLLNGSGGQKKFTENPVCILYKVTTELLKSTEAEEKVKTGFFGSCFPKTENGLDSTSQALLRNVQKKTSKLISNIREIQQPKSGVDEKDSNVDKKHLKELEKLKNLTKTYGAHQVLTSNANNILTYLAAQNILHAKQKQRFRFHDFTQNLGPINDAIFSKISDNRQREKLAGSVSAECNRTKPIISVNAILAKYPVVTLENREGGRSEFSMPIPSAPQRKNSSSSEEPPPPRRQKKGST